MNVKLKLAAICWQLSLLGCWMLVGQTSFPRITQMNPNLGEPGTVVIIQGTGFTGVSSVLFGVGDASFETLSATVIRAVVPEDATTGAVVVSTNRGFATSGTFFQVAPRIERFEPEFGKPGDTILLRGANFSGLTQVRIGSSSAAFSAVSDSQLSFIIPTDAVSGAVHLDSPAGSAVSESSLKVIGPEPYVTSFEPSSAAPGTLVAIRGVQFSNASEVSFGAQHPGEFNVVADTQILVRVPADAVSGPVTITTPLGQGISLVDFLVLGSGPFVASLEPDHGQRGDTILVSGINLTGVTQVLVNDLQASFEVVADTQMSFVIPEEATSGPIIIRKATEEFVFEEGVTVDGPGPVLASFSPSSGLPGDTIQFNGSHFTNVESVRFGDREAAFLVTAETQMTAEVPAHAESAPITIVTAFGETESAEDFVVRQPAPEWSGFDPAFGSIGSQITLQGIHFNSVTNVVMGGKDVDFQVVADTQILARVPAEATTDFIALQSSAGTVLSPDLFYLPARITSILPDKAIPGDQVEVRGANFTGVTRVRFDGVESEIVSVESDALTVKVPAAARIGPVSVSTPAGSIASPFDFGVLPKVDALSPVAGPVGSTLQIFGRGFTEVTDVVMGLVSTAFNIKSPELLEVNIPFNATSGPITVRNAVGESVSAESFQIRISADLSLEVELNSASSSWHTPAQFTIRVHNAGPTTARNFFVRHQMPEAVARLGGSNVSGSTDVFGNVIVDGVANLAAGETVEMQHVLSTPFYGFQTHQFNIDADIFDPTPDDQTLSFRHRIIGPPVRLNLVLQEGGKIQLNWPAALRGYHLQMNDQLEDDGWLVVPQGPVFDVDRQYVELEGASLQTDHFFRLLAD